MKFKGLIIFVCMVLLCGCQSSKTKGGLDMYNGKNGKDTYETAINYFNKTVKYYRTEIDKTWYKSVYEYCALSNGNSSLSYHYINDYSEDLIILATKNDQKISALDKIGTGKLQVSSGKYEQSKEPYMDITKSTGVTVKDIEREDSNNQIILNIKVEELSDITKKTDYEIIKVMINNEGLIEGHQSIFYTDSSYKKIQSELDPQYYKDINKVGESKFMKKYDTIVEAIKECEGLTLEEGYNKIKDIL